MSIYVRILHLYTYRETLTTRCPLVSLSLRLCIFLLQSGLKTIVSDEEGGLEVRIYYLECLAQATYIVSHDGAAFIVDPRRDVEIYIKVDCSGNTCTCIYMEQRIII